MNIEIDLRQKDDNLMVVGNLDKDDEISTYDIYGYDEQENRMMFKLTREQVVELLDCLIRRSELEKDAKRLIKEYKLVR